MLRTLLAATALSSLCLYSQSWSGVLSSSRAVDWSNAGLPATLPDGETTANPWTPPTRTQCGSTISPIGGGSDDTPQIKSALSACAQGGYVLLGSGTFQIKSDLRLSPGYLSGHNNITLRGSGAQSTKLVLPTAGVYFGIGAASGGGSCTLASDATLSKGSTSLKCTGSSPVVGQPAWITQCDTGRSGSGCTTGGDTDNGGVWVCAGQTICSNQLANASGHSNQKQTFLVTGVTGTCSSSCTVSVSPGLYMSNWAYSSSPVINWNDQTYTALGVGIEDVTIDFTSGGTSNSGNFYISNAYASWVRGVRFIGPNQGSCVVDISQVGKILFANNYIFASNPVTMAGAGLVLKWSNHSDTLLLNNIFHNGGGINFIEGGGSSTGNVLAYNYFRDSVNTQVYNGDAEHYGGIAFTLREGNVGGFMNDDATWGTHNFDTAFRNYYSCDDPPYSGLSAPKAVVWDNYARFENAIGNALGGPRCSSYSSSGTGSVFVISSSDSLVSATSMRWGNYDTINAAARWNSGEVPASLSAPNAAYSNPLPVDHTLPASFFMNIAAYPSGGTGLNYWKTCTSWSSFPSTCSSSSTPPMPPIGPDVSGGQNINGYAYNTPAVIAYNSLPVDTTYQQTYTITGSSWSGGTETLTITGLPSSTSHLMGGFQLSGVNSACLPSSGASYTARADGEILITAASSTTISYALSSNPGVGCTGSFKFPNVRQFDASVYQLDASAATGTSRTISRIKARVQ